VNIEVGERVVVPGFGVGVVEAVEKMEVETTPVELYRIGFGEDGGHMWIPLDRMGAEGVRGVMSEERVASTWETIESTVAPEERANWNRRQRRYNEALMSNQPKELAALIGELGAVQARKPLSFGERKIFDKARSLLVAEIVAATGQEASVVETRMEQALAA